jgi:hypothetical protein
MPATSATPARRCADHDHDHDHAYDHDYDYDYAI